MVGKLEEASDVCPYGELLEVLGKPHTLQILYGLGISSPSRFTELQKGLDLQPKLLTARLRELLELGLVARKSYNEIPPGSITNSLIEEEIWERCSTNCMRGRANTTMSSGPEKERKMQKRSHDL